jgi:hypothetical protein
MENTNGVNEVQMDLSPGRFAVSNQVVTDRHQATGRKHWSRFENILLMKCYFLSKPDKRGYRQRFHDIYRDRSGNADISEQNLADRARYILKRGTVLSEVELEEIQRQCGQEENETNQNEQDLERREESQTVSGSEHEDGNEETDISETHHASPKGDQLLEEVRNMMEYITVKERPPIPPKITRVEKKRLVEEISSVDKALCKIRTRDLKETNDLILAGALVVTRRLGVKHKEERTPRIKQQNIMSAQRRIEKEIEVNRKDLSRLKYMENSGEGIRAGNYLEKKYNITKRGTKLVREVLRQRIKAATEKIKRFRERNLQYRQNRLFCDNQKKFYQEMEKGSAIAAEPPDPEETIGFWKGIWSESYKHRDSTEWINAVRKDLEHVQQEEDIVITEEMMKKVLGRMRPWKAPGPDGVQAYWIKQFNSVHDRICDQLNDIVKSGTSPQWMTSGRTVLIPKDPVKGNIPSNYRPITCLPIMWKLMSGIVAEHLHSFLTSYGIIPWEQKGCGRGSRGAKHHLLIDKAVMNDSRSRKTSLAMGWIDYKKAYDMVPHSWISQTLDLLKVPNNVKVLIKNSMQKWNTRLESNGAVLGKVNVNRGIFQGDSLSPLLFVMSLIPLSLMLRRIKSGYNFKNKTKINHLLYMDDLKIYAKNRVELESLINTVRIFSEDIGMEFGLHKCAILVLKRGKVESSTADMLLPNGGEIKAMGSDSDYRYLGVLECDTVRNEKVKDIVKVEYKRRLVKILKSKLNSGNLIKGINTYAVAVVRYTAGIIKWNEEELEDTDRRTRKLLTLYGGFHPKSDVDRLYVERCEGGRGLISIRDVVRKEEEQLYRYTQNSPEDIMATVMNVRGMGSRQREDRNRLSRWTEKVMHGQFVRQTENVRSDEGWLWLKRGNLKRETESLITAAQEQALRTNYRRAMLEREGASPLCRMCKESIETVDHIVSGCSKLAQQEYKARHDRVATAVHWSLMKKFGFEHSERWYNHRAETVYENESVKILWDMNLYTDHVIEARRPDIVVVNKQEKTCQVIDIAVPLDRRVEIKEDEKCQKYRDLCRELSRLWGVRCEVIPIVVGALGTTPKRLGSYLALLDINVSIETIQLSALLGSARILRQVLEIKQ